MNLGLAKNITGDEHGGDGVKRNRLQAYKQWKLNK